MPIMVPAPIFIINVTNTLVQKWDEPGTRLFSGSERVLFFYP